MSDGQATSHASPDSTSGMHWLIPLLALHAALLAWSAARNSYTWDEVAHLPSGISHWKLGNFELFRVNPPLVRMIAALPVLFADPKLDWSGYSEDVIDRPERPIGERFLINNGERSFLLLTWARWACLPFSLIGAVVCFLWARELYGAGAGLLAAALWCFGPNVLAHAALITPDVPGAALGVLAFYVFWHWLKKPSWVQAVHVGLVFGVLQLTKSTWVFLFGLWPLLWVWWRRTSTDKDGGGAWSSQAAQLASILTMGWMLINLGYGFEGTGRPLGEYEFLSTALGGPAPQSGAGEQPRNPFRETWLASVPVPLPKNYVQGIDRQKYHFERLNWSYLAGEWRQRGWWYYYLYALAIKVPLGTWILVLLASGVTIWRRDYRAQTRDEVFLLLPLLIVLFFVSSQTGINRHLRYALPLAPFAFILMARLARAWQWQHWRIVTASAAALAWSIGSSLWYYPHSLSYFNELVGGPTGGPAHLLSSNTDWGQDLLFLRDWIRKHPEAQPLGLAWYTSVVDPKVAGIEAREVPATPQPGWYAVSVNHLHAHSQRFRYFLSATPVDRVGYSINVYHFTAAEVDRLARELGYLTEEPEERLPLAQSQPLSSQEVCFATLSPDLQQVAVGGRLSEVKVIALDDGAVTQSLPGHDRIVSAAAFTNEGDFLVTGGNDALIRVWEMSSGECVATLPGHAKGINRVVFSPGGDRLATAGNDGVVILWDWSQRRELRRWTLDAPACALTFSPAGDWLATGTGNWRTREPGRVQLWDVATGEFRGELEDSRNLVKSIAISPTGDHLAARSNSGQIGVWSVATRKLLRTLVDSQGTSELQFLHNGRFLVAGDFSGRIKIWSTESGRLVQAFQAHDALINAVLVLPDERRLITASRDGKLRMWSVDLEANMEIVQSRTPRPYHGPNSGDDHAQLSPPK